MIIFNIGVDIITICDNILCIKIRPGSLKMKILRTIRVVYACRLQIPKKFKWSKLAGIIIYFISNFRNNLVYRKKILL